MCRYGAGRCYLGSHPQNVKKLYKHFNKIFPIHTKMEWEKGHKMLTGISMLLSIFAVLFLAMTREAYAITFTFILVVMKGMLLLKYSKLGS